MRVLRGQADQPVVGDEEKVDATRNCARFSAIGRQSRRQALGEMTVSSLMPGPRRRSAGPPNSAARARQMVVERSGYSSVPSAKSASGGNWQPRSPARSERRVAGARAARRVEAQPLGNGSAFGEAGSSQTGESWSQRGEREFGQTARQRRGRRGKTGQALHRAGGRPVHP